MRKKGQDPLYMLYWYRPPHDCGKDRGGKLVARRLIETYRIGNPVEILFEDEAGDEWRSARVVALQHPGVWVITDDRRLWFVTNGKRIQSSTLTPHPESS
jgi:hypothetical protein